MTTIKAAVVTAFDRPPRYEDFDLPEPRTEDEIVVDVLAAGLHPRVRSGASGSHYTSSGTLPLVPGIDGVGRRQDGRLVYFVVDDDTPGSMARRALVDARRSIELPDDADIAAIAAAMNPAMSSWVALRRQARIQPGASVLVLGATGAAGAMAVQVSKLLGAGRVVAAGRDAERLRATAAVGADATVRLDATDPEATGAALAAEAAEVDIVLDYLWGEPTAQAMLPILLAREDRSRELDWVQIGSMAGLTLELPSALLRQANLRLSGSGQGSVSPRAYLGELPALVEAIDAGSIAVRTRTRPLADVESAWTEPEEPGVRTVIVA